MAAMLITTKLNRNNFAYLSDELKELHEDWERLCSVEGIRRPNPNFKAMKSEDYM